jgi:hypothetical protein
MADAMNVMPLESLSAKTVFTAGGPTDLEPVSLALFRDILMENARAHIKHGMPSPNPTRAIARLCEEIGEAARCSLKATSTNAREYEDRSENYWLGNMREELVQVASVAIRIIQDIDSGRVKAWVVQNRSTK